MISESFITFEILLILILILKKGFEVSVIFHLHTIFILKFGCNTSTSIKQINNNEKIVLKKCTIVNKSKKKFSKKKSN
jgi:hypothetical protein